MLRVEIHLSPGSHSKPATTRIQRIYPQSILELLVWGSELMGCMKLAFASHRCRTGKLKDDQAWERDVGPLTLIIEPGRIKIGGGP